ncbi:RNA polymerase sigma factor [Roseiconus lacunae]|uniref:Sigma-70 family RNA polymerase sigma factor n=1 Tax=Roseiconus lacunae TaxID=2605694 RepID=A0ABT7PLW9_9BACT|nr:sigma-70 family RNA polymerase sigma factor [Roseiconus lacunae]MDM4017480.1 sigma-70 family RNA polymerase sigma factor [Roseiconus lacunae]
MADHQSPSDSSGLPRETKSASGSASLDEVWNAFGSQLRRRARTRLRQYGLTGQTESMDICNEVMVDLARRSDADQLTAEDILSYILRAIDNEVVDTFRTLARHCRDFRRNESTPVEDIKLRTEQTSPSQVALRREVADRVRSILGEQDAVAVDMMLENRDWSEIGERLGVKADTARMRVRRALQRVRDEIGLRESE